MLLIIRAGSNNALNFSDVVPVRKRVARLINLIRCGEKVFLVLMNRSIEDIKKDAGINYGAFFIFSVRWRRARRREAEARKARSCI